MRVILILLLLAGCAATPTENPDCPPVAIASQAAFMDLEGGRALVRGFSKYRCAKGADSITISMVVRAGVRYLQETPETQIVQTPIFLAAINNENDVLTRTDYAFSITVEEGMQNGTASFPLETTLPAATSRILLGLLP